MIVQSGQSVSFFHDGWQPMEVAPRDGTIIELMCTYGVAPWYGLFYWSAKGMAQSMDGGMVEIEFGQPRWVNAKDKSSGVSDEPYLKWRPFNGGVNSYVDPTGGAQNSMAYWRDAVATKYGLPFVGFLSSASVRLPWYVRLKRFLFLETKPK